ncbi:hypothetical protein HPG69_013550 [Diceros bicornis minor]|uniref:protein-tyrosine-phosphatase n=1 Tax=Diceros bicornis minor TaxID=77932 RepID=A0A7J7EPV7_DICBM|nr:hypothetical protein HPG69_013550 [Diceros bicornis minor]
MSSEPLPRVGSAPALVHRQRTAALCKGSPAWWGGEVDQLMLAMRMNTEDALYPAWGREEKVWKSFLATTPRRASKIRCLYTQTLLKRQFPPHSVVIARFGDYDSSIHHPGYLSDSQFIPDQSDDFLMKVESLHKQHSGLKQSEAESCYINIARTLDFYGVELHSGRDLHNLDLMIGIASSGIAVYRKYICTSFYPWVNILKISFKRKKFFIHQRQKQAESREHIVAFNMLNYRSCKNLWKSCVEHHTFFQAKKLLPQEKNVLSQYWTLGSRNPKKSVNNQYCKKVIGGMVWNPAMRRSLSVEHLETKSLPSRSPPITPNWRSPRLRHEIRKPRHSSADNLTNEMTYITETEDVFYTYRGSLSPKDSDSEVSQNRSPHRKSISENNPAHSYLTQKSSSSVSPSSNAPGSCSPDGVDQQFLEDFHRVTKAGSTEDSSQYYCDKNDNGDGYLVLIRITPDEDGKFGFNLKGGVDQKMPLVVSRINPESPADTCIPKLNEGDQIVLINGRDISEHTHDQVVMFIKASRESHTRELALVIRRKDELNQLFPEAIFPVCPEGADTLEGSMEQLKKGLESGTVLIQFEVVSSHEGLPSQVPQKHVNMSRNRSQTPGGTCNHRIETVDKGAQRLGPKETRKESLRSDSKAEISSALFIRKPYKGKVTEAKLGSLSDVCDCILIQESMGNMNIKQEGMQSKES